MDKTETTPERTEQGKTNALFCGFQKALAYRNADIPMLFKFSQNSQTYMFIEKKKHIYGVR